MPYIKIPRRRVFTDLIDKLSCHIENEGELNYVITMLLQRYTSIISGTVTNVHEIRYDNINTIIGVLECVKNEFYRRVAIPFENKKIKENSDVYGD